MIKRLFSHHNKEKTKTKCLEKMNMLREIGLQILKF